MSKNFALMGVEFKLKNKYMYFNVRKWCECAHAGVGTGNKKHLFVKEYYICSLSGHQHSSMYKHLRKQAGTHTACVH